MRRLAPLLLLALAAACGEGEDASADAAPREAGAATETSAADALGAGPGALGPEEIERGRRDRDWRRFAEEDRAARLAGAAGGAPDAAGGRPAGGAASRDTVSGAPPARRDTASAEAWSDIGSGPVDVDPAALPLEGEAEGPSVLAVQVMLDRARFSPGVIDGYWGKNTEKAIYWLQSERGLEPTGTVDRETLELLRRESGASGALSREVALTEALVSGPFTDVPDDVYAQAEMECLCYGSPGEKLAERFHTTREVLEQLNGGVDLDALAAGETLVVPDHGGPVDSLGAREPERSATPVARIVISDGGHYLHALAEDGSILYHFPSTLGSEYAPSPSGDYAVNGIARDPTWHYQPELLTGEPDDREDAIVPPGPNNPVGVVWIDLTKPHYGIHGTAAPSTIGYATSHGCVRLTNWDVAFLADRAGVASGTPVEFRSGSGRPATGG